MTLVRYRVGGVGSLISSTDTTQVIENALKSLDRVTRLRGTLSKGERPAYRSGQRRLLPTLAYAQPSQYNVRAAQAAVVRAWRVGAVGGPRSLAVHAASFLPVPLVRGLHALTRQWRRWRE